MVTTIKERAYRKKYREEHKEKEKADRKKYYKEHKEKEKDYQKKYYKKNKDKIIVYKILNNNKINITRRKWSNKNRDKETQYTNNYRKKNNRQVEIVIRRVNRDNITFKNQKIKTIKRDIEVLKAEIKRIKKINGI